MTPTQQKPIGAPQQDMAVLDQVKKQRGKGKRLTTEQILQKATENSGLDAMTFQNALANLVKSDPNFRVARSHNTLFMYYNMGNGGIQIMMETADNPRELVEAIADSVKAAKVAGFKTGFVNIQNPTMLKAFKMANVKYKLQPGKGLMPDGKTPQQVAILEF